MKRPSEAGEAQHGAASALPNMPAEPLRRDQVLAFIIERIARFGISPSFAEIGRALGISPTRARQLVDQLVRHGAIEKTPGAQRNLRVRDVAHSRSLLEVALRRLGWITADPAAPGAPSPDAQLSGRPGAGHCPASRKRMADDDHEGGPV